ncbi:bestrophin-like domain [Ralstonia mannitolilytica]|uniref:DUF4239 domain-containing protein n=1 Tax=Ralstonia mannitolilytica TaxID=105219 RepID=A0AAJ5D4K7_9RALS|nr:hypothetical protein [Ralstonia mannitolilytica]CAG2143308.1 hypothetical protein LMG6866_02520 [Ralstonia mannitolilytica]CAJ0734721.1 hypothetical protein R77592_03604 [Ralstonia mannitolilytica]SUD86708.1 Uncharacterised protein [Ralstonia mannitolilytica]SUD92646.1 Uncharacterised protein [Ralstonia mannitolilytica]SUD96369.1 Uncharacterised protein [Ralstonia mannitolilytica]
MSILGRCITISIATFSCAIAGVYVHKLFPVDISLSEDIIKSVSGLIGTLFAIVLGLLVSSSYATFNNHQADFNSLINAVGNIDLLLKQFPGVSDKPRTMLRRMVVRLLQRYWSDQGSQQATEVSYAHLSEDVETMLEINRISEGFEAVTRDDLNAIRQFSSNFIAIQSNIVRSLSNQVPALLLVIVFGWACLLFFLYGSLSGGNIVGILFILLGAVAIASANFLILELTHPYQGLFKVSSAPFDLLLRSMIQEGDASGHD